MLRNGVVLVAAIRFALTGLTGMLSNVSPVFDDVTAGVISMLALALFALLLALTLQPLLIPSGGQGPDASRHEGGHGRIPA